LKAIRGLKLKSKVQVRDFDKWWDQFLGGNLSLKAQWNWIKVSFPKQIYP
jgi:hypothetical protein